MASFNFTRVLARDFGFLVRTTSGRGADQTTKFKEGDTIHLYYGVPQQARIGSFTLLAPDDGGSHFEPAGTENSVSVEPESNLVEVKKGSALEALLDRNKVYERDPQFGSYVGFALERIDGGDAPHFSRAFGRGQSTVVLLEDDEAQAQAAAS